MKTLGTLASLALLVITGLAGCTTDTSEEPAAESVDEELRFGSRATCGTRGAAPCAKTEYCKFPASAQCGAADQPGRCARKPIYCAKVSKPVCGCDGATHDNRCVAARAGVSVAADGACKKACSGGWETILAPTVTDVQGVWTRESVVGAIKMTESLRLRSDSTYVLTKTNGPHCEPGMLCQRWATQIWESTGMFVLNPGQGIQLVPSDVPADDMALSWSFERPCGGVPGAARLASTELGVDVTLARTASCIEEADCKAGDAGAKNMFCMMGTSPATTCTAAGTCGWTCKATDCPAGQRKCMMCGAPPPDGICRSFSCVKSTALCPLVQ